MSLILVLASLLQMFSEYYQYSIRNLFEYWNMRLFWRCLCPSPGTERLGDRCVSPPSETCTDRCPGELLCRANRCYQNCGAEKPDCPVGMNCIQGNLQCTCSIAFLRYIFIICLYTNYLSIFIGLRFILGEYFHSKYSFINKKLLIDNRGFHIIFIVKIRRYLNSILFLLSIGVKHEMILYLWIISRLLWSHMWKRHKL